MLVFERAWALLLLVPLAVLVLVAHLFLARRRPVTVPSLIPWKPLQARASPGARRRWRPSPRLLFEILLCAFLVAAASGPALLSGAPRPAPVLVLIDRTASMQAPAGGRRTRMDAAKDALAREAASLPPETPVLLRGFPPLPGGDRETTAGDLGSILDRMKPTGRPGTLAEALGGLAPPPQTSAFAGLIAVSDGTGPPVDAPARARIRLVGGDVPNAGIEAFVLEPLPDGRVRLFVRVRNASEASRDVALSIRLDGEAIAEAGPLSIGAGEAAGRTLFPEGLDVEGKDVLEISLSPGDAFPGDDRVFAASGNRSGWTVALAGKDAPYLARALQAVPGVDLEVFGIGNPGTREEKSRNLHGDAAPDLFVFHRVMPPSLPRTAPCVVVDPESAFGDLPVARLDTPPPVRTFEGAGDAGRAVEGRRFRRVSVLDPAPADATVLARCGPGAVVARIGAMDALPFWFVGLPVGLEASDWPHSPWFPIFWKEMVLRAAGPPAAGKGFGFFHAGRRVVLPLESESPPAVVGPGGAAVETAVSKRNLVFRAEEPGLYRLEDPRGGKDRRLAVNLLAPSETELSGREASYGEGPDLRPSGGGSRRFPLARVLATGAAFLFLLVLFLEGKPLRRKRLLVVPLLFCLPLSCGSSSSSKPETPKLSPGRSLPAPSEKAPEVEPHLCPECGRMAGPGHVCGLSAWCPKCKREASLEGHVCGLSHFCPKCKREASLVGHRCGETKFCPLCKMEVPLSHTHEKEGGKEGEEDGKKKPWGKIH